MLEDLDRSSATPRALVTGASSGIGAAFARRLSATGHDVVLVGRDADRLRVLADELTGPAQLIVADLTEETGLCTVESMLADSSTAVELLVNSAGAGWFGPFADHDPERLTRTVSLNVTATIRLCRAALPSMLARRRGCVVTVSSNAAAPKPGLATYVATKAFLDSWASSLSAELSGTGVAVVSVRPGYVRTAFHARAGESVERVDESEWLSPDTVAQRVLDAMARNRSVVTVLPDVGLPKQLFRGMRDWHRRGRG